MLECLLTCVCVCVCALVMCMCVTEQEKSTGSTGGGGVGGGWLWRISQGLKAGIQAERIGGGCSQEVWGEVGEGWGSNPPGLHH